MELDVRCSHHAAADLEVRCQLFAGHEREHAALWPGTSSRTLVLWSNDGDQMREVSAELAAGRPWAPGCPRLEKVARSRSPELHGLASAPEPERTAPRGRLYPVDAPSFDRPA